MAFGMLAGMPGVEVSLVLGFAGDDASLPVLRTVLPGCVYAGWS